VFQELNEKDEVDSDLRERIDFYFDYKYKNDRKIGIDEEEEQKVLEQLPAFVENAIYTDFLYYNFLTTFKETFKIPNK